MNRRAVLKWLVSLGAVAAVGLPISSARAAEPTIPSRDQKIDMIRQLLENALRSHDELIEKAIFKTHGWQTGIATVLHTVEAGPIPAPWTT
jgi:hypothetical protein